MSLKTEKLIQLTDEFTEFSAKSAFITHALVLSLNEPDCLTPEISSGARYCTDELLRTVLKIKDDIKALQADEANTQ